jgi:Na+/H+ antiporter NhaD/arsenite permease-like protein
MLIFIPVIINSAPQDASTHIEYMRNQFTPYIVASIFIILYIIMLTNKITPALVTMFGALLFVLIGFVPFNALINGIPADEIANITGEQINNGQGIGEVVESVKDTFVGKSAIEAIDWNTLALLSGMMILVGILKSTGFFKFIAIKIVNVFKGNLVKIWISFCFTTAVMSAFLDNVTTILIIAPITLLLTDSVGISPAPLLITEVLSANIGGTATLIGDPPNILIGSAAGFSFVDFILNLAPMVIVILIITILIFYFVIRKDIRQTVTTDFDPKKVIKNKGLLTKALIVFGLVLVFFISGHFFHLEPGPIALFGAILLMIIGRLDSEDWFKEVEWDIIFFFIGLFVMVKALDLQGILDLIGNSLITLTGGDMLFMALLLIWFIGIASSFLGAVPIVTTLIPIIFAIQETLSLKAGHPVNIDVLWWSASLGACLGGNGTIFGTATSMVVVGITKKRDKESRVSFFNFIKIAYPVMLLHLVLSSVFIYVFYFVL